jgi:hypothetical protein
METVLKFQRNGLNLAAHSSDIQLVWELQANSQPDSSRVESKVPTALSPDRNRKKSCEERQGCQQQVAIAVIAE